MVAVSRWTVIRYVGVVGSALLAVAATLGGALPRLTPTLTPMSLWHTPHGPVILATWLIGTGLMAGAWWSARTGVPSLRWAYLTAGLWVIPLLGVPPMGSRDVYAYVCQGAVYAAGHHPYHEGVAALPCPWLSSVSPIWRTTPAPYGPLFVMLAGAAVRLTGSLIGAIAVFRGVAIVGLVLMAVGLPRLARHAGIPAGQAAWLALACPLIAVHLVGGMHNDAFMMGLVVVGLALLAQPPARTHRMPLNRLLGSGVVLGLAIAIKVTAAVIVPFAVIAALAWLPVVRWPQVMRTTAGLCGAVAATVVAMTYGSGLGWGWWAGLSRTGTSVQWTAPFTAVGLTIHGFSRRLGFAVDAVPVTRAVGIAVLGMVVLTLWCWLVMRPARYRDAVRAAGMALAATVALEPVFHAWYATWPLVILAAATATTTWFVILCALACFLVLPDGSSLALSTKVPGALAMTALVMVAAGWAVRWAYRRFRRRPTTVDSSMA